MKIQDIENELHITRANIRFYEKEGLINPKRKENGYRDYSQRDVAELKKIIIYRKLGIPISDIKMILCEQLSLQEAVSKSMDNLQNEIEKLNGSIKLCQEIQNNHTDNKSFNEEYYWNEINYIEKNGKQFSDICKDYIDFEKPLIHSILKYYFCLDYEKIIKKHGILWLIIIVLAICIIRGASGVLIWKNNSFWVGFLQPFIVFSAISIILLPLFLLKEKHHKIAMAYLRFLNIMVILIVAAVILLFAFLVIKSIF